MPTGIDSDYVLPNFLLLGAPKAGTTALAEFFRQHPHICFSRPKETWFFTRRYDRGIEWFASHFDHYRGETAIGEGSAGMLVCSKAPQRIAACIPDARLICVLRNPIERAFSHYYFYLYTGKTKECRPFGDVIRDEDSEIGRDVVEQGKYIQHLRRYEEHFSRDQLDVALYRTLREDPQHLVKQLYDGLGVDSSYTPVTESRHNVTKYPVSDTLYAAIRSGWTAIESHFDRWMPALTDTVRSQVRQWLFAREKPEMKEVDRAYLQTLYEPYNRELEQWLGTDLSHWT